MFYSEQLLSKEGPLAHVWLAANLERKLTKYQLLSTDISKSSEAIVASSESNQANAAVEPLALRLTGTLLYGVVRIYSRKAKYLLDDVSEALMRLKTAFRSSSNIILPPQATVIPSMKQVLLQDTVTASDLLWQEPLNLDDSTTQMHHMATAAAASHVLTRPFEHDHSFDTSIEVGRGEEIDELAGHDDDDLQLDFDLGDAGVAGDADLSVELGRDAASTMVEDATVLPDLTFGELDDNFGAADFGGDGIGLEFENPATPTDGNMDSQDLVLIPSPSQQQAQRKKRSNKFAESDIVRTSKRRITIDDVTELTSAQIRERLNESVTFDKDVEPSLQKRFDSLVTRSYFQHTYQPASTQMISNNVGDAQNDNSGAGDQLDLGNNTSFQQLDFGDAVGVGNEFDDFMPEAIQDEQQFRMQEDEEQEQVEDDRFTKDEIASNIMEALQVSAEITFTTVMEQKAEEIQNPKRHATNCFFELLVLASSNKIDLQQDALFSEINIVAK